MWEYWKSLSPVGLLFAWLVTLTNVAAKTSADFNIKFARHLPQQPPAIPLFSLQQQVIPTLIRVWCSAGLQWTRLKLAPVLIVFLTRASLLSTDFPTTLGRASRTATRLYSHVVDCITWSTLFNWAILGVDHTKTPKQTRSRRLKTIERSRKTRCKLAAVFPTSAAKTSVDEPVDLHSTLPSGTALKLERGERLFQGLRLFVVLLQLLG